MKWEKVKFSEIFDFQKKSNCKAGNGLDDGLYPFFTSSDVQRKFLNEFHFDKPGLIFGTGGQASVHFCKSKFAVSTDCFVVHPKDENVVVPNFVYYYLNGNIHILEEGFKGAGLRHISKEYLSNIDLPLPPLPTQLHIAAILDHANNLRQLNKQLLQKYDELAQSVFTNMFGDEETLKKLPIKPLKDVSEVVSGVTKGRKFNGKATIEVPYMRVANVQDGHIDLMEIKTIEVLLDDVDKFRLKYGDIILTEGGDPDKLGRGAVWKFDIPDCIHQNHIFRVRANQSILHWDYLSALLGSKYGKKYFLKAAKQTTGIASINSTQLRAFPVPIPHLEPQNKYSLILEKLEKQKVQSKSECDKGEILFQSLMQRAFNN